MTFLKAQDQRSKPVVDGNLRDQNLIFSAHVAGSSHIDSPQSEIRAPEQAPPHVDLGKGSPVGKVFQRQDSGNSESRAVSPIGT